ncbi:MAG: hypothetical protein U9Q15_04830 [Patescibacteria group bacterium]|nr:hypothetical protein [Patescibacteria group bacterium]
MGQWTDDYYAELSFGDDSDAQVISSSSAEFTHEYVEPGIYPIEFFLKKNHDTIIDIQQYVFVSAENYPLSHIRYREKGTEEWVDVDPLDEMIFLRNIEYEFDASLSLGSE